MVTTVHFQVWARELYLALHVDLGSKQNSLGGTNPQTVGPNPELDQGHPPISHYQSEACWFFDRDSGGSVEAS